MDRLASARLDRDMLVATRSARIRTRGPLLAVLGPFFLFRNKSLLKAGAPTSFLCLRECELIYMRFEDYSMHPNEGSREWRRRWEVLCS
jgi:hypothetical protein